MFTKISIIIGMSIASALLAGCQAINGNNGPSLSTLDQSENGVTCSKCQTTWVKIADNSGSKASRISGITTRKSHVCPDCRDAATNFFATGKLQHTCKACGDSLEVCEAY